MTTTQPQHLEPKFATYYWLDGPGLAAWFREEGLVPENEKASPQTASVVRAVKRWDAGERASIWSADRWLIYSGRHLSELPDELWLEGPYHFDDEAKEEALRLLGEIPLRHVAQRFGVAPATVRYWRERARAAA